MKKNIKITVIASHDISLTMLDNFKNTSEAQVYIDSVRGDAFWEKFVICKNMAANGIVRGDDVLSVKIYKNGVEQREVN